MLLVSVVTFAVAFGVSLVVTYLVRRWALSKAFVDRPGGHKAHAVPVALGGGVAIVAAILVPTLGGVLTACLLKRLPQQPYLPQIIYLHLDGLISKIPTLLSILAGAIVLHVVGLVDDVRPLSAYPKLAVQFGVAIYLAGFCGVRLLQFEFLPAAVPVVLTVLWIVVLTNAFNFLDNMDGLCASVALIASAMLLVAAVGTGQLFIAAMLLVLLGAVGGFAVFNFPPAKIFMGDSGSLVVGYMMAVLTVLTSYYGKGFGGGLYSIFTPVVILAVPLYDFISVCVLRIASGHSPLLADRRHFSHRLLGMGFSVRKALLTICLATACTGAGAILLGRVGRFGAVVVAGQTLLTVLIIALLESGRPAGRSRW